MNFMPTKWSKLVFLIVIAFLQLMVYITVLFNIPIARQVLCFFYFTFIPGFIIVKLLKLNELDGVETVLLSIGFSVAFLMLAGLIINEIGGPLGISQPLSVVPLMIILNSFILVTAFLTYLRNKNARLWVDKSFGLHPFALLFLVLPILSIVGAIWANAYDNNFILLFMIIAISSFFIIGILSKRLLPPKFYPFAIIMIAIALLFQHSFISNHLISYGSDLAAEYSAFKNTENVAFWNSTNPFLGSATNAARINVMLSVTILPTIDSSLLIMDSVWLFKILYPLLFSLVPLGLYGLWEKRFGSKFAFFATFLFMAQQTFYTEMLGINRQIIAELFFVLLLVSLFSKKMKTGNKIICFIIFSFALVTSHYGLAQIVLFLISLTLIYLIVLKSPRKNLTAGMVVLFFVMMFLWYIYTASSAVFESIVDFGGYVYNQLGDFFNPASRGATVLRGLGLEAAPSIWNLISRAFAYITQALIVVGFFALVKRRKNTNLEVEYFVFTLLSVAFLAALILVPGLANTLNMTRFYHILLFFLAPLCALGANTIVQLISKHKTELKTSILLLTVLIPYFLFQVGFVYEVTGSDCWSVPLSKYRMPAYRLYGQFGYTTTYSIFGAEWISNNVAVGHTQIYADVIGRTGDLRGYGSVDVRYVEVLSNATRIKSNGVVYLNSLNIIEGIFVGSRHLWNTSELGFLSDLNILYSNGGCEIYRNSP